MRKVQMNDFTKEELLIMLLDIELHNEKPTSKMQILINKLKSMIDNYCEHEFVFTLSDSKVHCHKCKRGLNEDK